MKSYTQEDLKFIEENKHLIYLNLDFDLIKKIKQTNEHPLRKRTFKPEEDLLRVIRDPKNFHFTCKYIFNKDIHPFQNAVLQELWNRPFPMLLGSRGSSKCTSKDTYIQTENRFCKITDLIPEDYPDNTKYYPKEKYLVGENGCAEINYVWSNGKTDTITIETNYGYKIEVTLDHKLRAVRDNDIQWIEAQDLKLGDKIIIDRNAKDIFPDNQTLPSDLAYFFGLIVGDGGYTVRGKISFTTADKFLADQVSHIAQKYFGKPFKKDGSKYGYNIFGVAIWDDLFNKYGFNSSECGKKDFPTSVLSSNKESICAFIRGLMDTDGFINQKLSTIGIAAKSQNIIRTLQFVLSRLGILSKVTAQWNKKYERFYYYLTIRGDNISVFKDKIGFGLPRKQELLDKAILIPRNTNKDLLPHSLVLKDILSLSKAWRSFRPEGKRGYFYERQLLTPSRLKSYELSYSTTLKILELTKELSYREDWQKLKSVCDKNYFYDTITTLKTNSENTYDVHLKTDHSFISNGFISHNTFMLALYCALRATINQECKIVITGAAFRQAKVVFEYIQQIWDSAPVWRDLVGGNSDKRNGPHHDTDRWWFGVGASTISALPVGDGSKIRGYRANYLISDEFSCVGESTLIETDFGLIRIKDFEDLKHNIKLINEKGQLESPIKLVRTPLTDVFKVTTKGGYTFKCSSIHKVKTENGYKLAKDLMPNNDYLISVNQYKFPNKYVKIDDTILDENLGWIFGLLTSEGCISSDYTMAVSMTDKDCLDRLENAWKKFNPSLHVGRYTKNAYIDPRGWECKQSFQANVVNKSIRELFLKFGLDKTTAHNKKVPWSILQSPKSVVVAFLAGAMEGDGSCFLWKDENILNKLGVAYYSVSEQLCSDIQILLQKLDLFSVRQPRESKLSNNLQWMLRLNGQHAVNLCRMLDIRKWDNYKNSHEYLNPRGEKGIYFARKMNKWCAAVKWKKKNHHLGYFLTKDEAVEAVRGFRKKNIEGLSQVTKVEKLPDKEILYDFYLPETHSFYGNGLVQHNSQNPDIYENVIAGFAFVSANPIEKIKQAAIVKKYKEIGIWGEKQENNLNSKYMGNQSILASTCYYDWNHLYKYYCRYKAIIESQGDPKKLELLFNGPPPDGFNYKDYSIIRLPIELVPEGMMDVKQVQRSKVTTHSSNYLMEFSACFSRDSNGFFKRTLIESCVAKGDDNIIKNGQPVKFRATVQGNPSMRYVYGIDPAAEADKFSIVILELHPDHSRIVYCWTTDKADHREKLKAGIIQENDFYGYINTKVRALMKVFPCMHIAMDSQGGGGAVMESFRSKPTEEPLLLITPDNPLSDKKERDCDGEQGLHIVELVSFAKSEWTSAANHNMRMDFEHRNLLFPYFDPLELTIAENLDLSLDRIYDTLEECVMEIEDLKDELATIIMTKTSMTGREHWDTPETKESGSKKGRMRKDRYSALLMANAAARVLYRFSPTEYYRPAGGVAGKVEKTGGQLYTGPAWFVNQLGGYGNSFKRV